MHFFQDGALLKTLIPTALTVFPALLAIVITWARDLNRSARRVRDLDEASKRVSFWKMVSDYSETGDPLKNIAEDEIDTAARSVRIRYFAEFSLGRYYAYYNRLSLLARSSLWHKQPERWASMLRLIIYLCALQIVLFLGLNSQYGLDILGKYVSRSQLEFHITNYISCSAFLALLITTYRDYKRKLRRYMEAERAIYSRPRAEKRPPA